MGEGDVLSFLTPSLLTSPDPASFSQRSLVLSRGRGGAWPWVSGCPTRTWASCSPALASLVPLSGTASHGCWQSSLCLPWAATCAPGLLPGTCVGCLVLCPGFSTCVDPVCTAAPGEGFVGAGLGQAIHQGPQLEGGCGRGPGWAGVRGPQGLHWAGLQRHLLATSGCMARGSHPGLGWAGVGKGIFYGAGKEPIGIGEYWAGAGCCLRTGPAFKVRRRRAARPSSLGESRLDKGLWSWGIEG